MSGLDLGPTHPDDRVVVRDEAAGKFRVHETIPTARGAKTMAIDLKSKRLYLPTAEGLPPSATGPPRPNGPQQAC